MFASIFAVVAMIVSMVISIVQQRAAARKAKKAQEEAERAEDMRKGIEVVTEGESRLIPVVYGRAKIGGARVFHAVQNNFYYAEPNSDHIFGTGINAGTTSTEFRSMTVNGNEISYKTERIAGKATSKYSLNETYTGIKNEYLYWQQALCYGPINQVIDVLVEDSNTLDNPVYGSIGTKHKAKDNGKVKYSYTKDIPGNAIRIDVHLTGGIADAICTRNNANRSTALFTGVAYASCVSKQDRDDPAFSAVPKLQFLVEGLKIHEIIKKNNKYILNPDTVKYTTNPATILADYLTNKEYGAGLPEDLLHLESFYEVQKLSSEIVLKNAAVGGLFWQNSDGSRKKSYRNIPRFECCVAFDGSQSIRDNVNQILKTIPGSRLIWSQGKFKLILNYPKKISDIDLKKTIDDTDIVLGENIDITGTTGDNRYNWCKVTYQDETQNFEQNSVSWPPKKTELYMEPIGGRSYTIVTGWATTNKKGYAIPGNSFLNSYAVAVNDTGFNGIETAAWVFMSEEKGSYTLQANGEDKFRVVLQKITISNGVSSYTDIANISDGGTSLKSHQDYISEIKVNLEAGKPYRVVLYMQFTDVGAAWYDNAPLFGAGFCITSPSGVQICCSRDAAYSGYIYKEVSDDIYQTYLKADSYTELETEITADGITDYYHALALAEQTVRQSRSASMISLKVVVKDVYYELGDIVAINSKYLNLGTGVDINGKPLGFTYYKCISSGESHQDPPENTAMWVETSAKKNFKLYVNGSNYNKGDIVYYTAGAVTLPFFEVDSVQYEENDTCSLTLKRFDPDMLAWNVEDDQLSSITPMFAQEHLAPAWVTYERNRTVYQQSAGHINWAPIQSNRVKNYSIFINIAAELDAVGNLKWTFLGEATEPPFILGNVSVANAVFGVCANYDDNVQSSITMSGTAGGSNSLVFAWNPVTKLNETNEAIKANFYRILYKDYKNVYAFNMIKGAIECWRNGENPARLYFRSEEVNGITSSTTPDKDPVNWRLSETPATIKWAANTKYVNGNLVLHNNKSYICIETVGRSSTSLPIVDSSNWTRLNVKQLDAEAWVSGTTYQAGDLTYYQLTDPQKWTGNQGSEGGYLYVPWERPPKNLSSIWQRVTETWSSTKAYAVNSAVLYNNIGYRCISAVTGGYNPASNTTNWEKAADWSANTVYADNKIVMAEGIAYQCKRTSSWIYCSPWMHECSYKLNWVKGQAYPAGSLVSIGALSNTLYYTASSISAANNQKSPNESNLWQPISTANKVFAVVAEFWKYYKCKKAVAAKSTGNTVPENDSTSWVEITDYWQANTAYGAGTVLLYNDNGIIRCYKSTTGVSAESSTTPVTDPITWALQETGWSATSAYNVGDIRYRGFMEIPRYTPIDFAENLIVDMEVLNQSWAATAEIIKHNGIVFALGTNGAATPSTLTFEAKTEYFNSPKYEWYFRDQPTKILSTSRIFTLKYADYSTSFGAYKRLHLKVSEKVSGNNERHCEEAIYALSGTVGFALYPSPQNIEIYCNSEGIPITGDIEAHVDVFFADGTTSIPRAGKKDSVKYNYYSSPANAISVSRENYIDFMRFNIEDLRVNTAYLRIEGIWLEDGKEKGRASTTVRIQKLREALPDREVGWYEFYTERAYEQVAPTVIWRENLGSDFDPIKNDRMVIHTSCAFTTDENGEKTPVTSDGSREVAYVFDGTNWVEQKYYMDGNLLVQGTVTADGISTLGIEAINANIEKITANAVFADTATFTGKLDGATGEFAGTLRAGVLDFSALAGKSLTKAGWYTLNEIPDHCTKLIVTAYGGGGGGWAAVHGTGQGGSAGGAIVNATYDFIRNKTTKAQKLYVCSTPDYIDENEMLNTTTKDKDGKIPGITAAKASSYFAANWKNVTQIYNGALLVIKMQSDTSKYMVFEASNQSNKTAWKLVWTHKNVNSVKDNRGKMQIEIGAGGTGHIIDNDMDASVAGNGGFSRFRLFALDDNLIVEAKGGIKATGTTLNAYASGTRTASKKGAQPAANEVCSLYKVERNVRGRQSLTSKSSVTPPGAYNQHNIHPLTGKVYSEGDGAVGAQHDEWSYGEGYQGSSHGGSSVNASPADVPQYNWQSYDEVGGAGGPSYLGTTSHSAILNKSRSWFSEESDRWKDVWHNESHTYYQLMSLPNKATYGGGGCGGGKYFETISTLKWQGKTLRSQTTAVKSYQSGQPGAPGAVTVQFYDENSVVLRKEYDAMVISLRSYLTARHSDNPWTYVPVS